MKVSVLILVAFAFLVAFSSAAPNKVVCYYGSWSVYREGNGKFQVEDIDPFKCTHLIYAFVGINTDASIRVMDPGNDITNGAFKRFNDLKKKNPALKTLVAVGGWNEGSITFSQVSASKQLRSTFIQNAANFVKQYGFDGFDLDWEYPAQRGGSPMDKTNFALLLQEFRPVFDQNGLILTAAVAAASGSVDISYDVPSLSRYLDFINVMAYDLHGSWDGITGQNAPLYPASTDVGAARELNVASCINGWIARGAAPEKLVLGIGTYGRSFTLSNAANHGLDAPSSGPGVQGPYTKEAGNLGYNEICENLSQPQWSVVWDDEQKVPYAYSGNQWVGYDNAQSVTVKVEFAKEMNLGGAMIWSIETDDFRGSCGSKYPILSAINAALGGSSGGSSTSSTSTTTQAPSSSTEGNGSSNTCQKAGYYRDPSDCKIFYNCIKDGDSFIRYQFICSGDLVFNTETNNCDYPSNVQC